MYFILITCLYLHINTYVKHELEEITQALRDDFNYNDTYEQQVKDVLNYDETMDKLNNLF